MTLAAGDKVAYAFVHNSEGEVILISELGYMKRCLLIDFERQARGGKGVKAFNFLKNGANGAYLAGALLVREPFEFQIIQKNGTMTPCNTEDVSIESRSGRGAPYVVVVMDDVVTELLRNNMKSLSRCCERLFQYFGSCIAHHLSADDKDKRQDDQYSKEFPGQLEIFVIAQVGHGQIGKHGRGGRPDQVGKAVAKLECGYRRLTGNAQNVGKRRHDRHGDHGLTGAGIDEEIHDRLEYQHACGRKRGGQAFQGHG